MLGCLELFDLLDTLPLDVVQTNAWMQFTSGAKASFRGICIQSRNLAHALVTEVNFNGGGDVEDSDDSDHGTRTLTGVKLESWHQDVEQRATYLASLPHLTSLNLSRWGTEGSLTALLTRCGDMSQGRIKELTLSGSPVSVNTGSAICLACPGLQRLTIDCTALNAQYPPTKMTLTGDIFLALRSCPLTTVSSLA